AMHAFERGGRIERPLHGRAKQRRALNDKKRPEPLAAAERPIAHSFEQPRRSAAKPGRAQPTVKMAFETACMGFQAFCKDHGGQMNLGAVEQSCARTMD